MPSPAFRARRGAAGSPSPRCSIRDGDEAARIIAALAAHPLPPGNGSVWIGTEASLAKTLRSHLVEERGHPSQWLKASGYWKRGQADVHERIGD